MKDLVNKVKEACKALIKRKSMAIVIVAVILMAVGGMSIFLITNSLAGGYKEVNNKEVMKLLSGGISNGVLDPSDEEYIYDISSSENETICAIYKAAIDYAMENIEYNGGYDNYMYWAGVHKAVNRLADTTMFKLDINKAKYEGKEYYKVSEDIVNEIGDVMWGMESAKWQDNMLIDYVKKDGKDYYFSIIEPANYYLYNPGGYLENEEGYSDEIHANTCSVTMATTLVELREEYIVKVYKFELKYPSNNRLGFSIADLSENNMEDEISPFQCMSNNDTSRIQCVAKSNLANIFVVPYIIYEDEYTDKKEAMWNSIYMSAINYYYDYMNGWFDDALYGNSYSNVYNFEVDNLYDDILYSVFGSEPNIYYEDDNKEYLIVSEEMIKEMMHMYTGKRHHKAKSIPEYLNEKIVYKKGTKEYYISLDKWDKVAEKYDEWAHVDYAYSGMANMCVTVEDREGNEKLYRGNFFIDDDNIFGIGMQFDEYISY